LSGLIVSDFDGRGALNAPAVFRSGGAVKARRPAPRGARVWGNLPDGVRA